MPEVQAIGIDLGTTYSAVASIDASGRTIMVRSASGQLLTPSVVYFDTTETIVGHEAKKAAMREPDKVAECAKRDMGNALFHKEIGGQKLPPEVIQACILRQLKSDAEAAYGPNIKVVITVPAYFDEPRRKATADAGEMAGLEVLSIVNEPTAAALAFGERLGYLADSGAPLQEMNVLVYDLGGGTFDVTLIQLRPGEVVTLATDGDVRLGGRDWDDRLVEYVAREFQARFQFDLKRDAAAMARVYAAVEEAKHTLTARQQASIKVDHQGLSMELAITRQQFEELTEDLLERTAYTTRQVLQSAGLDWRQLSRILLVGGSSRMPMVTTMLKNMTGILPDDSVNPDEAVARGAAIFAEYMLVERGERQARAKLNVVDVNSHSLGIEGIDPETMRKLNTILIPRNTALPKEVARKFVTKMADQRSVVVQVLEGESRSPSECAPIARAAIRNLPPGLPQGSRIRVVYRYDRSGRLVVKASVPGTGREAIIELERDRGISGAGVSQWKKILSQDGGFNSLLEAFAALQQAGSATAANPAANVQAGLLAGAIPTAPQTAAPVQHLAQPMQPTLAGPLPKLMPLSSPGLTTGAAPTLNQQALNPAAMPQPLQPMGMPVALPAMPAPSGTPTMAAPSIGANPPASADPMLVGQTARMKLGGLSDAASPTASTGMPGAAAQSLNASVAGHVVKLSGDEDDDSNLEPETDEQDDNANELGGSHKRTARPEVKKTPKQMLGAVLSHIVASTLGLLLGYYILCFIRPELNFLGLGWPGIRQVAPAEPVETPTEAPNDEP